jgi:hypothetical protein
MRTRLNIINEDISMESFIEIDSGSAFVIFIIQFIWRIMPFAVPAAKDAW